MSLIEQIRTRVAKDEFEFSQHAVDQSILRRISVRELREAFATGELMEDYPEDKYGPSCLVLGFTENRAIAACPVQRSVTTIGEDRHRI